MGTVRYCADPANGASYNWVIDYDGTIIECAGWGIIAWHASYLNQRAWSVGLCQGTSLDPITELQHRALRWLMGALAQREGVPLVRAESEDGDGWIEHRQTDQGRAAGKSDVGNLNWGKLGL